MRRTDATWAYWGLFGLGLAGGGTLFLRLLWRLNTAFIGNELTRATLGDALVLSLASLAMLLTAGWAFVHRPARAAPPADADPFA